MFKQFNEKELSTMISGQNKSWLTRTINKQKKYGNYGCIDCVVKRSGYDFDQHVIVFTLGESQGTFVKQKHGPNKDQWIRDYGNLYKEPEVTRVVNELAQKLGL